MKKLILFLTIAAPLLNACATAIPKEFSSNISKESIPKSWENFSKEFDTLGNQSILGLTANSQIRRFVQDALENSLTVKDMALRLKETKLVLQRESASLFPSLNVEEAASRSKATETSQGRSPVEQRLSAGLGVSWELDIWGRVNDQIEANKLEFMAVADDLQAARTLVAANILRAWVRHSALAQIINLEQARIESLRMAEDVIADRFRNGLGDLGDLDSARAATATAMATINERLNAMKAEGRRLYVLSGQLPQNMMIFPEELPDIKLPGVSGPADVIGRRPDLKRALVRIRGADKNASAVYKDILPSFKITASSGKSGPNLSDLLKFDPAWSLITTLSAPIFDAGLRKNRTAIAENDAHRKWLDYRSKLINAVEEIENALALEDSLKLQTENRLEAQELAQSAYEQQAEKYASGLTDVMTLLISERTAFDAKIDYLNVRQQRLENRITLALALGYEE